MKLIPMRLNLYVNYAEHDDERKVYLAWDLDNFHAAVHLNFNNKKTTFNTFHSNCTGLIN